MRMRMDRYEWYLGALRKKKRNMYTNTEKKRKGVYALVLPSEFELEQIKKRTDFSAREDEVVVAHNAMFFSLASKAKPRLEEKVQALQESWKRGAVRQDHRMLCLGLGRSDLALLMEEGRITFTATSDLIIETRH